jgi:hypothetical protein
MPGDATSPPVRGLEGIFRLLLDDTNYEILCIANMILPVVLLFYFLRHPLRLGRLYRPGTPKLKYELNATWAVFFSNSLVFLTFQYVSTFFGGFNSGGFAAQFFLWIHVYRSIVMAWFRARASAPWPLEAVLYHCVNGAMRGTLAARAIAGETDFYDLLPLWRVLLIPLILILAIAQAWLDYRLSALREPGERGYKVPDGFPFTYISSPSYFLEIVIWVLWGMTIPIDFGTIAIWLWLLPNVYARAEAIHRWYHRTFKGKYPRTRTAILPFVSVSTLFAGYLTTMQY